jgi:hypothetical protein
MHRLLATQNNVAVVLAVAGVQCTRHNIITDGTDDISLFKINFECTGYQVGRTLGETKRLG